MTCWTFPTTAVTRSNPSAPGFWPHVCSAGQRTVRSLAGSSGRDSPLSVACLLSDPADLYGADTLPFVKLKKIAILDILVLAFLYTIRIIAGGVASNIQISKWLLAISIFVFISLALAKRCAEIIRIKNAGLAKIQGRGYSIDDLETVRSMGIASGFMSALVLALYIESPTSFINYNLPELLWITPPIFLAWIMRIWIKTGRNELTGEDPLQFSLKDKPSWICLSLIFIFASIAMVG